MDVNLLNIIMASGVIAYISLLGYYAIKILGWLKDLKEHKRLIEKYRTRLKAMALLKGEKW